MLSGSGIKYWLTLRTEHPSLLSTAFSSWQTSFCCKTFSYFSDFVIYWKTHQTSHFEFQLQWIFSCMNKQEQRCFPRVAHFAEHLRRLEWFCGWTKDLPNLSDSIWSQIHSAVQNFLKFSQSETLMSTWNCKFSLSWSSLNVQPTHSVCFSVSFDELHLNLLFAFLPQHAEPMSFQ